jgi:hypothetical protein
MNRQITHNLLLAIGFLVSTGCAGYDRILFATKTNVGLDIDDKPPTAEITIARRELAITPTFKDAQGKEKTLPLLASFGLTGNFLNPEITSRFAGGEAALVLAQGPDRQTDSSKLSDQSSLCLSELPEMRPLWKKIWHSILGRGKEDTRAFYFATDTAFGLKVAWDGVTGPYPSSLKLGYNRRELAFPPIFSTKDHSCKPSDQPADTEWWRVTVPSFVASLDNSSTVKEWFESGVTHTQFFATGRAASAFVERPAVNAAMNRAMYPHNELLINPTTVVRTVLGTQTFQAARGTGLVRFTIMQDTTGGATVNASTGLYTAGPNPGTSVVGAADEVGKAVTARVTVNPALAIVPNSPTVPHGEAFQFKATGGVPPFKFTITDNQSGSATIEEKTGLYKAGSIGGRADKVNVIDSSSPPNSAEATASVQ